jgi:hypothetical protein
LYQSRFLAYNTPSYASTTNSLLRFNIRVSNNDKMHQHPRPSPLTASPASSPRTNPTRTNNPRDEGLSPHSRAGSDMPGYNEADEGSGDSGVIATSGPSRDAVKKLDQIIQVNTSAIGSSLGRSNAVVSRTSTPKLPLSSYSLECHYPLS